jgi:hypothetical protein
MLEYKRLSISLHPAHECNAFVICRDASTARCPPGKPHLFQGSVGLFDSRPSPLQLGRWASGPRNAMKSTGGRCGKPWNKTGDPTPGPRRAPRLAGTLPLAQAQSNRGPGCRKKDFPDAERLVKRPVAQELTLSFVPDTEQRLWRNRDAAQVPNHPKPRAAPQPVGGAARGSAPQGLQDRVGPARRQRSPHAAGPGGRETDPTALAGLAAPRLRATSAQRCDAFQACPTWHPDYRRANWDSSRCSQYLHQY